MNTLPSLLLILCLVTTNVCTSIDDEIDYAVSPEQNPHSSHVAGIYSFGKGENFPNTASLKFDYVAGMTSIFTWASLEPEEGRYDFKQLDKLLAWATKNNKQLNIALYAGNLSPSWLESKKIPMIRWQSERREDQVRLDKNDGVLSAPAFWDRTYVEYWKKFVSALAREYKDRPEIGYVSITGGTPKDLSTGTVIKSDADWQKLVAAGYTYEKHFEAWRDITDHFVQEFPNKDLVLALGPLRPGGGSSLQLSEDLVNHILKRQYQNVNFLCVILNDSWFLSSPMALRLRNLFKMIKENGHKFGYQMIYAASRMDTFDNPSNRIIKSYHNTLDIAIEDGASWIEIWHDDIVDPRFRSEGKPNLKYSDDIKRAAQKLK